MIKTKTFLRRKNHSNQLYAILLLLISSISSIEAKDIFFDSVYGNSGNIANKIQLAINQAAVGDVIIFASNNYALDGATTVIINKAVTLQGRAPGNQFDPNKIGTSGIQTTLDNTGTFQIRSNNVKFRNIRLSKRELGADVFDILIDARHTTYLAQNPITTVQQQYTGIVFRNVRLNGAAYTVHTGNGIGVAMNNTSIVNYRRTGYWANRFGRVDTAPKATINKCEIKPDPIIGFDDRAISIDAGNNEYPVIWDFSGTIFKDCFIQDSGIALSRIQNLIIDGCIFNDSVGAVDLVHIEEFSNNIRVRNNIFNCNVPSIANRSRIVQLDRELQVSSNLRFIDNTINGSYNFFISAYAPNDIVIRGNNFTNADAINNNAIDFTFYEARAREPIPSELASNDITIENNPGLNLPKNKGIQLQVPNVGARLTISGVPVPMRRITRLTPASAIFRNGVYTITNKVNGQRLTSDGSGIISTNNNGPNTQWRITFNPPYTYHIQNVGNGRYLETHLGYTEFDIVNNLPQNILPFLNPVPASLPFWSIIKAGAYYEIFPGGNEKQSALATNGASPISLVHAVGVSPTFARFNIPIPETAKWSIAPVAGAKTIEDLTNSNAFSAYPNPTNGNDFVTIEGLNANELVSASIFNINGNTLQKPMTVNANNQIDVSGLSSGIYFIKVNFKTIKLVVE